MRFVCIECKKVFDWDYGVLANGSGYKLGVYCNDCFEKFVGVK